MDIHWAEFVVPVNKWINNKDWESCTKRDNKAQGPKYKVKGQSMSPNLFAVN